MTDEKVLYTASAGGYTAACDAFVVLPGEKEEHNFIYFLSLLGPQTSVRAISAAMCKQRPDRVYLIQGTEPENYEGDLRGFFIPYTTFGTWTIKSQKLPLAKGYHSLVYTRMAEFNFERPEFVIIARNAEEAPALHYRFLDKRSPLPFSPDWQDWLWERAIWGGEVKLLESHGVTGYYCKPDFEKMAMQMQIAIRNGSLKA